MGTESGVLLLQRSGVQKCAAVGATHLEDALEGEPRGPALPPERNGGKSVWQSDRMCTICVSVHPFHAKMWVVG